MGMDWHDLTIILSFYTVCAKNIGKIGFLCYICFITQPVVSRVSSARKIALLCT
jgi:hypothetical protein